MVEEDTAQLSARGDAMLSLLLTQWKYVVMGLLLAFIGVQQIRIDHAATELAQEQKDRAFETAQRAELAEKAEVAAREEEQRRETAKQEVIDEAHQQTAVAQADAASATAASASLRSQLTKYAAAVRKATSDPVATAGSSATTDPIGLLADMLSRIDERQGRVASYADSAHIAGAACERYADGLQPTPRP